MNGFGFGQSNELMKARRIIWPVLLTATGFACLFSWLTISQQTLPGRIKVESDVTDIPGVSGQASAGCSSYNPYFIQENRTPAIFLPVNLQPKQVLGGLDLNVRWGKHYIESPLPAR